ncbi:MAG: hypoxanthine phosphoribosyltransferase [Acidobacteria bacterium]|nr:hypoxanthine phosphoribosyltransferase [Acidobacteriota bacterium]
MAKERILFTPEEIDKKVSELADEIAADYKGKELAILGVLKGCFFFLADLIRELRERGVAVTIDFVKMKTDEEAVGESSKKIIIFDTEFDIRGKDVLVVEDILDTGVTLNYLLNHLKEEGPGTIRVCVLLDKPFKRKVDLSPDYVGFEIPDKYVFGYGLDYQERLRELPYIAYFDE